MLQGENEYSFFIAVVKFPYSGVDLFCVHIGLVWEYQFPNNLSKNWGLWNF